MNVPVLTYLSIAKQSDGIVTLDDNRLRLIRIKYAELYGENDPDNEQRKEETLKQLIYQLQLSDDQVSLEYLTICVMERTDSDAKLEISAKFKGSVEFLEAETEVNDFIHEFLFQPIQQDHLLAQYALTRIRSLISSL
jgi:hypothetical protein